MTTVRSFMQSMALALLVCAGLFFSTPCRADILNNSISVHDPSRMVYAPENGRWYIWNTGVGIPLLWSTNQTTWNHASADRVFPSSGSGADNTNYWAPDMWPTPIHGQYYLFYSLSSGGSQNSSIKVVSTTSLATPVWTKLGNAVVSVTTCSGRDIPCYTSTDAYNAIDPCPYYDPDQDRLWLVFGSFWNGIHIVELNPSNPTQQLGPIVQLAGGRPGLPYNTTYSDSIEGAFVFHHDGYFYLTGSSDTCCAGSASTYKIVVGRSADITGPYLDRDGVDMRYYGGTIFSAGMDGEIGPGQFALYSQGGIDRFTYHLYSNNSGGASRLGGRAMDWDASGWPLAVFPVPDSITQGIYKIRRQTATPSLYLHATAESTDPTIEAHVEQDVLGTRLSQNWLFFPHTSPGGDTYYNIQNVGTRLWLTLRDGPDDNRAVPNPAANPTGSDFVRQDYANNLATNENQKWRVILNTDASFSIQSYRSGLMVGAPSTATTPLTPVVQRVWVYSNQTLMRFALERVTDTTPPVLTLPDNITVEAASAAGTVVTFTASAYDAISGSVPVSYSTEPGSTFPLDTTTVTVTAKDDLNNTATGSFTVTVVDSTPPTIDGTPADIVLEATGPSGAVATYTNPTATDIVDGTVAVICVPASGSTFAITTATVTCTATDAHNNSAQTTFTVKVQDTTPPTVSCGSPDGLWHATDADIHCTASDIVGLANPGTDASFNLTTSVPAGTETANASTNSRSVCDLHENCSPAGPISGNKVDKKGPDITITNPANAGSYLLNQSASANYNCVDGGSGMSSCSGPVASGAQFNTASVGSKSFAVTASDAVGNTTTATNNYGVFYSSEPCLGELGHMALQPINPDGSSVFKKGSTVPTKFRVCDANGNSIGTAGVVTNFALVSVGSGTVADVDEATYSNTPDPAFRWDPTAQQWIFNLSTKNNETLPQAGVTYGFRIYLNDGTWIPFQFGLK